MTFYCGIDLHSKRSHVCIIDKDGKKITEENPNNDLSLILQFLEPFGKDVHVSIESTINWYWIVDGLMEAGYDVRLAHTLGLYMITGAKVKTDRREFNHGLVARSFIGNSHPVIQAETHKSDNALFVKCLDALYDINHRNHYLIGRNFINKLFE